jgi:hypothetical protein
VSFEVSFGDKVGGTKRAAEVLETFVTEEVLLEVRVTVEGSSTVSTEELLKSQKF